MSYPRLFNSNLFLLHLFQVYFCCGLCRTIFLPAKIHVFHLNSCIINHLCTMAFYLFCFYKILTTGRLAGLRSQTTLQTYALCRNLLQPDSGLAVIKISYLLIPLAKCLTSFETFSIKFSIHRIKQGFVKSN